MFSMIYSKMTIEVILAHILDEPVRNIITEMWVTFFFFLIAFFLLEKFEYDSQKRYWIQYVIEIYSIGFFAYYLSFLISLVSKLADILDIKVFKINEPKEEKQQLDEE